MGNIKKSLSAKVFLWMALTLFVSSLIIYGIVMVAVPQRYSLILGSRMEVQAKALTERLQGMTEEQATNAINEFCINNQVMAALTTEENTIQFGDSERQNMSDRNWMSITSQPALAEGDAILSVIVPSTTMVDFFQTFLHMLPYIAAAILLVSGLSAWLCSRVLVKPVLKLSGISKRLARLDMTWQGDISRADELGDLARSLESMSKKISDAMEELETKNHQLSEEIETTKRMEKQRHDFFTAVSHELKTPVTVLKAQLESMMLGMGDFQNHEKYLPETVKAAEDMELLIGELLLVTKMEAADLRTAVESIDLKEQVTGCLARILPLAEKKQIRVHTELQCVSIQAEAGWMQKAISNILSNAVLHAPPGAEVFVSLNTSVFTVENTGPQIADEDLEELFTPFYRAEKSRNRKTGGTGLGLYLVKTILDQYGYPYALDNTEKGVRFTIRLNQN